MTSDPHYCEVLSLGRWCPQLHASRPETMDRGGKTYLASLSGYSPEVRAIRRVDPGRRHLTLAQLRECYSPEGKFQHV